MAQIAYSRPRPVTDLRLFVRRALLYTQLALLLVACSYNPSGIYRLQSEFETQSMAFRNEPLSVSIRLQNQSDQKILIGADNADAPGLRLSAHLTNAPDYLGEPKIVVGYRAGVNIHKGTDSASSLYFDRHADAVNQLAAVGPVLLNLSADDVYSNLGLLSNEAAFRVVIPVDWSRVPKRSRTGVEQMVVPVEFNISLTISYIGDKGQVFTFPGSLERHLVAYLNYGQRYPSGTLPAPNGPIEGEFNPKAN